MARLKAGLRLVKQTSLEFKGQGCPRRHLNNISDALFTTDVAGNIVRRDIFQRLIVGRYGLVADTTGLASIFIINIEVAKNGVRGSEGKKSDDCLGFHDDDQSAFKCLYSRFQKRAAAQRRD